MEPERAVKEAVGPLVGCSQGGMGVGPRAGGSRGGVGMGPCAGGSRGGVGMGSDVGCSWGGMGPRAGLELRWLQQQGGYWSLVRDLWVTVWLWDTQSCTSVGEVTQGLSEGPVCTLGLDEQVRREQEAPGNEC